MSDLVKIDRAALLDLVQAVRDLTNIIVQSGNYQSIEELERSVDKLKYVNKLITTSVQSYEKNNQ